MRRRLAFVVALLLASGIGMAILTSAAPAQDADRAQPVSPAPRPPRPARPQPPQVRKLTPPEDPARVKGSYQIGGEAVPVTEGDFYAFYEILAPHEEQPNKPMQEPEVLSWLLMDAEARALGCTPTQEELEGMNPLKLHPNQAEIFKERWAAKGIDWPRYRSYLAISRGVQRLKDLYANAIKMQSSEVFGSWRREHLLYRLAYVTYPAQPFAEKLRQTPPDAGTLKEFWSTNTQVQNKFRRPTTVSADVFEFDMEQIDDQELEKLTAQHEIGYEKALAYFHDNEARLTREIPSELRPKLYPRQRVPVEELSTPFQLLRKQIEREMLLGDKPREAYTAAKEAGPDIDSEAVCRKYGLKHVRIEGADRFEVSSKYGQYGGANFFNQLFNAQIGGMSPDVVINRNRHYFWRVSDRRISELPQFEEIEDKLAEEWIADQAYKAAQEDASAMVSWIDQQVNEECREQFEKIDVELKQRVAKEIETAEITDAARKRQVELQHKARAEQEKRQIRSTCAAKYFDQYAATNSLDVKQIGPFEFLGAQVDRRTIEDEKKQVESFLTTHYPVRAMHEGQVSQVLSDLVTRTHFVVKMMAKEQPGFERMSSAAYHQRRITEERRKGMTASYRWTPHELQKRRQWKPQ